MRPPLDTSDPGFDLVPARFRGSTCHTPNSTTLTVESGAQGKKLFVFDRVFSDQETQEAVWDYVSESVNSFVQGYNVSLLAYGQSGAGKSYTMGTSSPGAQINAQSIGMPRRNLHKSVMDTDVSRNCSKSRGQSIREAWGFDWNQAADQRLRHRAPPTKEIQYFIGQCTH